MITKEKNLIKIIDENQKEWVYDINLGKWIQGDVSGSTYIRFSMYTDKRTNDVCRYIVLALSSRTNANSYVQLDFETYANDWDYEFNADYIRYVDKCVSANVPCLFALRDYSPDFKIIMAHFGEYAKLVANSVINRYFRLCPDLPQSYIIEPLPEYEMDERAEFIVDRWTRNRYVLNIIRKYAPHYEKQFNELDISEKSYIYTLLNYEVIQDNIRYYETALYYFFKLTPYYRISYGRATDAIVVYIERCDFLKIAPRKESNFMKLLIDIDKEYQIKKREFNKQLLVERYAPHLDNLAFEDDKYVIVIPQTEEEFAEEARAQRNCVYSNYFPSIVDKKDSDMRIVFMRKKEDMNTPYITIEIHFESNWERITQALQKNNADVASREAEQFLKKYEEHLQTRYPFGYENNNANAFNF